MTGCFTTLYNDIKGVDIQETADPGYIGLWIYQAPDMQDPGLSPETIIFLPAEPNIYSYLMIWAMPIYFLPHRPNIYSVQRMEVVS